MSDGLVQAIHFQAEACEKLGAPFSAALLRHAKGECSLGGLTAHILDGWAGQPAEQLIRDAVPLRLLAALHYLVLSGRAPELAASYPSGNGNAAMAWEAARQALVAFPDEVAMMLAHEPQTNEVRRSACLLGGFLTIAQETGELPLRCFEIGASAGLNSLWDRFRYQIGDQYWGDSASPVVLPSRWEGNAPSLHRALNVAERHACDRRPVNIMVQEDATRLLSYCWADQQERMERLRAAIALAKEEPVDVQAENAAQWVTRAVPVEGMVTVVFHSVVWQYIPKPEQDKILVVLSSHAAAATPTAPFYWLRMEFDEITRRFELRLRTWDSEEDRLLAVVHPHGAFAIWQ